jgi:hypothetical protein
LAVTWKITGQLSPQMSGTAAEIVRAYKNEAEVSYRRLHF